GSIEMSQWDTDDPDANGFGAYMSGRPAFVMPALSVGSSCRVTFTPPPSCALIALPSACEMPMHGIVIDGSLPPMPGRPAATLFTTIMPIAPAACACCALTTNVQSPRSTSTMLPATAP